jgi:hypothetical protein
LKPRRKNSQTESGPALTAKKPPRSLKQVGESDRVGHDSKSSHPATKLLSPNERVLRAIEKDLPEGGHARKQFDHLCDCGCQNVELYFHLLLVVGAAREPKLSVYDLISTPKNGSDGESLSRSELAKLPTEIERVAEQITKVQRRFERLWKSNVGVSDHFVRQKQQRWMSPDGFYRELPDVLRLVAADLRTEFSWLDKRVGIKRYDSLRGQVLGLLKYVEEQTEQPHYGHLIDTLGPLFQQNDIETPAFLRDVDALTHFYSRAQKYGFRSPKRLRMVSAE